MPGYAAGTDRERLVRTSAISVLRIATPTTATSRTRMLSHRPSSTWGNDLTKYSPEKKVSLTRGQPGESFKPMTMTTTNTMVLIRLVIVD